MTCLKNKVHDTIYLKIIDQLIKRSKRFLFGDIQEHPMFKYFLASIIYIWILFIYHCNGFSTVFKTYDNLPLSSIARMTNAAPPDGDPVIRILGFFPHIFPSVFFFQFYLLLILSSRPSVLMSKPLHIQY